MILVSIWYLSSRSYKSPTSSTSLPNSISVRVRLLSAVIVVVVAIIFIVRADVVLVDATVVATAVAAATVDM